MDLVKQAAAVSTSLQHTLPIFPKELLISFDPWKVGADPKGNHWAPWPLLGAESPQHQLLSY